MGKGRKMKRNKTNNVKGKRQGEHGIWRRRNKKKKHTTRRESGKRRKQREKRVEE